MTVASSEHADSVPESEYHLEDASLVDDLGVKIEAHRTLSEGNHLRLKVTWRDENGELQETTFEADVTTVTDGRVEFEPCDVDGLRPPESGNWCFDSVAEARVAGGTTLYAVKKMWVWS